MNAQDLKNSILQLAIQGKLVEQRPEEGTAEELYEQIQAEKAKLIAEGKIKKEKALPKITEDEIPFEIPESWKWVRLGSICEKIGSGSTPKGGKSVYKTTGIKFLRSQNIYNSGLKMEGIAHISEEHNRQGSIVKPRDILLNITGGSIGRCTLVPDDFDIANINQHVMIIRNLQCKNRFLLHFILISPYIQSLIMSVQVGVSREGLSAEKLKNFLTPLPPLHEQKRIVAKIEELLPYVEKYGVAQSELDAFNKKFPEDMQKSILQYAIQGKLVEQRPEEGTAEELYEKIQIEKARLIADGKNKKEKVLSEITEDEIPFEIPDSWKWVRLGDISTYGQKNFKVSAKDIEEDVWVLDLEDIEKETGRVISKKSARDKKIIGDKIRFKKGDILYSKLRPYLKKILIPEGDGVCSPELISFNSYSEVNSNYLLWVLKAPHVDVKVNGASYGVKMPRVGTETMQNLLIPLPPTEEQGRIISKIEELLHSCENLKDSS